MTRHEEPVDSATATLIGSQLRSYAGGIAVPDIWASISDEITGSGQRRWVSVPGWFPGQNWITAAGTVTFAVVSVAIWVMFINGDDTTSSDHVGKDPEIAVETMIPADPDILENTLALLDSAGPFRIEGELFTTSRQRGRTTSLPVASDSLPFDGQTFSEIILNGHFIEHDCVEHGADRVCLLVFSPSPPVDCSTGTERYQVCGGNFVVGEPMAVAQTIGGTLRFDSDFVSGDRFIVERTLEIDPVFESMVKDRLPIVDLSEFEETVTLRQRDNRFFDSSTPGADGYGTLVTGSAEWFVSLHLDPIPQLIRQPDGMIDLPGINQLIQLEDIQRTSSVDSDGGTIYRATVTGGIGESGTFEMWTNSEGLPLRIEIEAFSSPRWLRHESGETEVTRVSLSFLDYGVVQIIDPPPALRTQ